MRALGLNEAVAVEQVRWPDFCARGAAFLL